MAEDDVDDLADGEPGPDKEPKSAKAWLAMIADAEKAFKGYQDKADNIDKLYADLEKLAKTARDRQFQLFWANIQVLGPSVYSRPPVPVVVPRFKDRRPLARITSELLERATVVAFETKKIDRIMRLVRDDLITVGRGCAWLRYEAGGKDYNFTESVCIEYVDRKDFLHDPARTWEEVDWVDRISYLTKKQMKKRFAKTSGKVYLDAAYEDRKDDATDDGKLKAKVHEIWCKSLNKVVWVSEGCDKLLDDDKPHLKLDDFFPCPPPAYGTVQRRSLVPIPDVLFYKDQLEEINELTARIGALTDSVKVRGFYPAGAGEIGDAVEAALKKTTDNQVLIAISNWAMMGSGGVKDMIVWLPLEMIAETIAKLIELRKQLFSDVYEITGLSDIMRGQSDPNETLGAQEMKRESGSVRVRDKQGELIRVARDITRIAAEIMAENFQPKTMLDMSQLEIPSDADIAQQIMPLQQQLQKLQADAQTAMQDPETRQLAAQDPKKAEAVMQQVQQQASQLEQQIAKAQQQPTIEKVMAFLRDQRLRPFVLDIETDSTIAPDENAQKQRATEFITAFAGALNQAAPMVQMMPQSASLMAEGLKFLSSQYRAGRALEGEIEEFADQMKQQAQQPQPNPEAMKAQAEQQAGQADAQRAQGEAAEKQANAQKTMAEAQSKTAEDEQNRRIKLAEAVDAARERTVMIEGKQKLVELDLTQKAEKHGQEMQLGVLAIEKLTLEIEGVKTKTAATVATTKAGIQATEAGTQATERKTDASIAATDASVDANQRKTDAGIAATERNTEIKAEQAKAKEPA